MSLRCLVPVLAVVVAVLAGPSRADLLYVIQNDNIYSYDVSLGSASAIAASKQAVLTGSPQLSNAQDIVFDSLGNFYVASMSYVVGSNGWVSKFNASGTHVSTITQLMNGPTDLAVNSANDLFVLDIGHPQAVVQYTAAGAVWGSIANLPSSPPPQSIAVNGAGDIYIGFYADSGDRIRIYDAAYQSTGSIHANWSTGLAVGPGGNLYSINGYGYVDVYTASGSYVQQFGNGNPDNLFAPAFDSAGNLYVLSGTDSISIAKFSTSGSYQFSWTVGTGAVAMTYGPVLVPEPSTYAMVVGGIAVGGWRLLRGRGRRGPSA